VLLFLSLPAIGGDRAYALQPAPPPSDLPVMVSDGVGGAIILWHDGKGVYGKRINSEGNVIWDKSIKAISYAVPMTSHSEGAFYPQVITDGSGGAIISWQEHIEGKYTVYAQRVDVEGNLLWNEGGVVVGLGSAGLGYKPNHRIASDSSKGAIIIWESYVEDRYDIHAQRLNDSGNKSWGEQGITVGSATSGSASWLYGVNHQLALDGSGGVVVIWNDKRDYTLDMNKWQGHLYAQKLDSAGRLLWENDKINIGLPGLGIDWFEVLADGSGNLIILCEQAYWDDLRRDIRTDIYVQKLDFNGNVFWDSDGTAICRGINARSESIVSDGYGGAFVLVEHEDYSIYLGYRSSDIYVHRIDSSGNLVWGDKGVAISKGAYLDFVAIVKSTDGAIVIWQDCYAKGKNKFQVRAQKIDYFGDIQWKNGLVGDDGIQIASARSHRYYQDYYFADCKYLRAESGGVFMIWQDFLNSDKPEFNILAQYLDSSGNICSSAVIVASSLSISYDYKNYYDLISDGSGGAYVVFLPAYKEINLKKIELDQLSQNVVNVPKLQSSKAWVMIVSSILLVSILVFVAFLVFIKHKKDIHDS